MGFKERLLRVRGEAPPDRPEATPTVPGLGERLARLQVARRSVHGGTGLQVAADSEVLAQAINGEVLVPGLVRVEHRVPLSLGHGRIALGDGLAALPGLLPEGAGNKAKDPAGWRLLDTETSGLAGGTGTWVFACGIGRIDGAVLVLEQFVLARLDAEAPFLAAIAATLSGASLLVTYNGKSFDLPLLATRLGLTARDGGYVGHAGAMADKGVGDAPVLAGPPPRLAGLTHLDLLHPLRRAFAPVWPDCRLATAEARLLKLVRYGDLPGSQAPAAWLDWLRCGRAQPLAKVLSHNRLDILSLASLGAPLALTLRDPARTGADPAAVAAWHRDRGDPVRALGVLEANRHTLAAPGLLELARLRLRNGDLTGAQALWEPMAEGGEQHAINALAKLYEHRLGDPAHALVLARRLPPGEERERRCRRLLARLGAGPSLELGPVPDGALSPSSELPLRLRTGAGSPAAVPRRSEAQPR